MCARLPWFKIVAVTVTITEKAVNNGIVLLKLPLDWLYKFLQDYDK